MTPHRRYTIALAIVLLSLSWFATLDYRKLIKPDEGRYAEIAREMAQSGDFVTPRLNGIKYFEKPPLQYWATASAFRLFGEHDWSARLWPALTGFFGLIFAAFCAWRSFGAPAAIATAAVLASSLLYFVIAHINTLDMGFTALLSAALFAFALGQRPAADRRWLWLAWAALALAVLSKGIVAPLLLGATLVTYSVATRDISFWSRLEWRIGLPIFFAIAGPWFIAVSLANPEFPRFFFIHEHFERFLTPGHRRPGPAWYFVPILLAGLLPWTTMALQALAASWRVERGSEGFALRRLLVLWCLIVFAFFSVSSSKLPSYILPLFPALALLSGPWLMQASEKSLRWHLVFVLVAVLIGLTLVPQLVARRADDETPLFMMQAYGQWLMAGLGLLLVGALAALALLRRHRLTAIIALALGGFGAHNSLLLGHESFATSNSSYYLARQVAPLLPEGVPFYSVGMYEQTFPYYLRRTLTLVAYQDEFSFGLQQEPWRAVASMDEFVERWQGGNEAFAIMTPQMFERLQASGLPMTVVARDARRIVVRQASGR